MHTPKLGMAPVVNINPDFHWDSITLKCFHKMPQISISSSVAMQGPWSLTIPLALARSDNIGMIFLL